MAQIVKRKASRKRSREKERLVESRVKTKKVVKSRDGLTKTEEEVVTELTLTVKVMKPLMIKVLCSRREMAHGI